MAISDTKLLLKNAEDALANHWLALHLIGIHIPDKGYYLLMDRGYINANSKRSFKGVRDETLQTNFISKISINRQGEVIQEKVQVEDVNKFKPLEDLVKEGSDKTFDTNKLIKELNLVSPHKLRSDIKRSDWYLPNKLDIPEDFYNWIESIRHGWQDRIKYEPFELYKEQAAYWLSLNERFPNSPYEDVNLSFVTTEKNRIYTNSLYGCNKYGIIKDDQSPMGQINVECWEVQAFILYLLDLGLSVLFGKPRQIGSTTIIALAQILKTMVTRNYYCKLVAQKGRKSEEIFNHKVKFPIENFTGHIKPTTANYNGQEVIFKFKENKNASTSSTSTFEVCAPAADVINAGTPTCTLLDEIGLNELLQEIIDNGRPTQFWFNPVTGRLEFRRQIFGWGTADASSPMFELVYKAALDQWHKRNFANGIIPIFVNSFSRPGFTWEHYNTEKVRAYSLKKQPGKPDPKIMFHQTYPLVEDDMWLISEDTIVPTLYIKKKQEELLKMRAPKRGYFEPIYDSSIKRDDPLIPYRIIGCKFVPASQEEIDDDSPMASIFIRNEPERGWSNRYYQGVDPIFASSGHSKMAASVWDSMNKTFSAWHNNRTSDYRFNYTQCLLLNLYYGNSDNVRMTGIKSLLEINVGGEYKNFVEDHRYGHTLVTNSMLPEQFQTTTVDTGIRKQGNNTKNIVTKIEELVNNFGDNIFVDEFWNQLRTFVKKANKLTVTWGPQDQRIHYDDIIDSSVYAYMNAECHRHMKPVHISQRDTKDKFKIKKKLVCNKDSGYNLVYDNGRRRNFQPETSPFEEQSLVA